MKDYIYYVDKDYVYYLVKQNYVEDNIFGDCDFCVIEEYVTLIGKDTTYNLYKHKLNKKIKRLHKIYEKYTKRLDNGYEQAIFLYHTLEEEDMIADTIKNIEDNSEWLLIYHNTNAKPNRYTRMTEKRRKFYEQYNIDVDKYFIIHRYKELNITLYNFSILEKHNNKSKEENSDEFYK
jgi:hypothetical protein